MQQAVILLISAAVAVGVAAAAAAGSGGDQGKGVSPELREQFERAVRDAGLEGQNVTGVYVPGKGWQVEKASPSDDGWTAYGPG
jgi:hypothetical protein